MFDRSSIGTHRPHQLRRSGQLSDGAEQPFAFATVALSSTETDKVQKFKLRDRGITPAS
ncbi:MAG TPA: hypothetical protein VLJ19_11415 [Variovorax sp.]|nr:hypothetical protein [Variovorax sp.]